MSERKKIFFAGPTCYCAHLPKGPDGESVCRCNLCWNGVVEGKNELVRENNELRARLGLPAVEATCPSTC